LIGAWKEDHFYYVKLRDLDDRADIEAFLLNTANDLSSMNRAASTYTYHGGTGVDWLWACLTRIVDTYWRLDGETASTHVDATTGMPLAKIHSAPHRAGILDSMVPEDDMDADVPSIPSGEMTALTEAYVQYQHAIQNGFVQMTFEDYLNMGGVRISRDESHIPEIVAFRKQWTLPSTGTDQNSGTTQSVWFWSMEGSKGNKDYFLQEPGFLVGLTCIRPKVYLEHQSSAQVAALVDYLRWLPPQLKGLHGRSLTKLAAHAEPFSGIDVAGDNSKGAWFDVMDLFQYGDQFVDFDLSAEGGGVHALPLSDMTRVWYPSEADMQGLFSGVAYESYTDGVVSLGIASSNITPDQTPGLMGMGQPLQSGVPRALLGM